MKKYSSSPLPFQGQKRMFVKHFSEVVEKIPQNAVVIDLFGGSGLLSHTVKYLRPDCRVIWNDYDNFNHRLNSVQTTNKILSKVREITANKVRKGRLKLGTKNDILEIIKEYDAKGFVDYVTISGNLLFSMNYANDFNELSAGSFYNKVRRSDYCVNGYLEGVERVQEDYRKLYEYYKDDSNVVFLLDPPYLSTDVSTYNSKYWKLSDYLDVLDCVVDTKYVYFTSNKGSLLELTDWMKKRGFRYFRGAKIEQRSNRAAHNTGYTDVMLHNL